MEGYFAEESGSGVLHPLSAAISGWDPDLVRGPAVAGALVRAAEAVSRPPGTRLARAAFEFFRPTRMRPSTTRAECVRTGRRLTLIDTHLVQNGEVTARAHILYVVSGAEAPGEMWTSGDVHVPPADDSPTDVERRLYKCADGAWTDRVHQFRNADRKQIWQRPIPIVRGEEPSAVQVLAATGDLTNVVAHGSTAGLEYINADLCLAVSREPLPGGVGLVAAHQVADSGVSVGSAVIFDAGGAFGMATVTGLSNIGHSSVDLGAPRN